MDLEALLKKRVVLLDGAMGTMLQNSGMQPGECPELYGIEHADILEDIHRQYIEAGADIIQTNTFGANRLKLAEFGLENETKEINSEAVSIARKAAGSQKLVAASIGPTGKMLPPVGDYHFHQLYEVFREQLIACERAGADIISIETMTDIGEMRAALIAAKQNIRLPILAHMTFEQGGRTMMGTDPLTALLILEALQPLAIGANCSGGADDLLPVIDTMAQYTQCYLSVEPNAGLPVLVGDQTVFPATPEEMAEAALRLMDAGANIIGGCCGTTPAHTAAMAAVLRDLPARSKQDRHIYAFASRSRPLLLGANYPLAYIGERINPTARKKLAQEIKAGQLDMVLADARSQVEIGAPMLDVNMGVPGIDEAEAMHRAVMGIQSMVEVPLSIDSTDLAALEAGLQAFVGRALINSTTGEDQQLDVVLPLAKKYGAAVLGLCLDEEGIPDQAEERYKIAEKIYQRAREYGLRDEDIFIDCLVKTASAEQAVVMETIRTVKMVKENLPVGTVLGVSNVSHGLPARDILNSAYLAMAIAAGLDLPILNPFNIRMMDTVRAADVLLDRDSHAVAFIEYYHDQKGESTGTRHPICQQCNIPELLSDKPQQAESSPSPATQPQAASIYEEISLAVLNGKQDLIEDLIHTAMEKEKISALDLVNSALIPGIETAGERYEQKEYFLPQLMMAAETMRKAFTIVKPHLSQEGAAEKGVIVLATVEGDIHDIGKNIVAVLLENYGFRIIDLGKDVPAELILDEAEKSQADIIGLSALMTTTMPRMREVVEGVKERGLTCRVMVGGAVLNQEYADQIGADAYSEDARAAVLTAQKLLGIFI